MAKAENNQEVKRGDIENVLLDEFKRFMEEKEMNPLNIVEDMKKLEVDSVSTIVLYGWLNGSSKPSLGKIDAIFDYMTLKKFKIRIKLNR